MQAIKTKYLLATNCKPTRIKAECEAGSITITYDYTLSDEQAHLQAVYALLTKLKWQPVTIDSGEFKGDMYHILGFSSIRTKDLPSILKPQA